MSFSPQETAACERLIALALEEDLGAAGDITSKAIIPADLKGQAVFVARAAGVVAGLPAVALVLRAVDPHLQFQTFLDLEDGSRVNKGDRLASLAGSMRGILAAERTALNFLQHLSGIATLTRQYVDAVAGLPCQILDTRKTIPGWRLLAKYAVRQGGGHNHRMGLFDGILIKDNHLAALGGDVSFQWETVRDALRKARESSPGIPVEIEVENLEQMEGVLALRPDIVLLDNMDLEQLREAVRDPSLERTEEDFIFLEASGGVTLETVRAIAETGVDRISIGALTHSAPALDIALDYQA